MEVVKLCRVAALLSMAVLIACGDSDSVKTRVDAGVDAGEPRDSAVEDSGDEPVPGECPEISFVSPKAGTPLSSADDKDKDGCANGFQYDVAVATAAADGTPGTLFAGGTLVGEAEVKGAVLKFGDVQLAANADATLRVQVGGVRCVASIPVSVVCSVPHCDISKPVLSPAHPKLNGVPVANGGDRVSSGGSPYQVELEVSTSVEEGQPVQLAVDGSEVLLTATARSGKAKFPGVTLAPDGDHQIVASCTDKSGTVGTSARGTFAVDSAGPDLTIASPADGAHYELVPSFEVCATSASSDARDLPSDTAITGSKNLCAAIGGAVPVCAAMSSDSTGGTTIGKGCVQVGCPGGAAFDVSVSLRDQAGNEARKVLSGITCRTDLPSVEIVSPSSTVAGDPTTRILSAASIQARKDADPGVSGAQFSVVACTEVENAQVQLQGGLSEGILASLTPAKTSTAATVQDGCPAGKPYAVTFTNVTLPESSENATGQLTQATRLVATVTDASNTTGSSLPVDVWVDSFAPTLSASLPSPLCGHFRQSATDITTEIRFSTSVLPLSLTITRPDNSQQTLTATTYTAGVVALLGTATFGFGINSVSATTTEASGNVAALPTPCVVTVGNPPIVTWTAPTSASSLNAANDADQNVPGWQGSLTVHTDVGAIVPAPTVQFSTVSGGNIGSPVAVDASGNATLSGITIAEGRAVQIVATTNDVATRGIGRATITVPVDTSTPGAIASLTAEVPADKRRQTTFKLSWAAPSDGGQAVFGYEVRVSNAAITDVTTFNAAERVVYIGAPVQPGQPDGIEVTNRYIERDYYFAVAPIDVGGNRGPFAAAGPARASFKRTLLSSDGTGEAFGRSIDGAQSLNGDAYADLVVGSGTGASAYIYFGAPDGFANVVAGIAKPSVTISGPSGVQFGYAAQLIGDIDGDGLTELAVGAPADGPGTTYIYKGRASWPASLTAANADYQVVAETTDAKFSNAFLGSAFVRLGDFDGDGAEDFALSGYKYATDRGYLVVVRGVPAGQALPGTITIGVGSPRTLETEAAAAGLDGRFGWALTNLGPFYGGSTSVLASTAYYYAGGGKRYGAAFAFAAGSLNAESPVDSFIGTGFENFLGWSIAPLGALGSSMAVAVGAPNYTLTGGSVAIHMGNTSTGPFVANPILITNAAASASTDAFGCVFGSVNAGVAASTVDHKSSFIGSTGPDVAMSGLSENGGAARLYLIDGQKVPTMVSSDVAMVADVTVALPDDWTGGLGCMPRSGAIRDLNNDGYADLAVAQYKRQGTYSGQVLVLW